MSDDYLWDRSGTPDPDVERLEQMLGRLRSAPPVPDIARLGRKPDAAHRADTLYVGARFLAPALAAAAAVVLMVGIASRSADTQRSWQVASLSGAPRIGSRAVDGEGRLAVGQTLVTDANSSARVEVGSIGEVTVGSNSRVRLVETRDAHHRLALDRGSLHAIISAPPGQFVVDTPSARATDLGCVYTLRVDEDGSGMLSVAAGWVAFEEKGHESFVPAGASSRMDPLGGPGTPSYDDADTAFHDALDAVDIERDQSRRRDALRVVLDHARDRDAMTLWHLIPRVPAPDRGAVADALARRVAMPQDVTRDAVMRLDRAALDRWWDALGLLDTTWWRRWKGAYPGSVR
jgi:FecR-like protein